MYIYIYIKSHFSSLIENLYKGSIIPFNKVILDKFDDIFHQPMGKSGKKGLRLEFPSKHR